MDRLGPLHYLNYFYSRLFWEVWGSHFSPPFSRNHMIIIIAPAAAAAASPAPPHNVEPPSPAAARLTLPPHRRPAATAAALRHLYRREAPLLSSMDPTSASNDATATHTVGGGRPVNTDGHRGRPLKKPSFGRDARLVQDGALAQDGAWLMTGPFRPPNEPPVFLLCCHCRVVCIWCFCLSRSASDNNNDATQGGGGGRRGNTRREGRH